MGVQDGFEGRHFFGQFFVKLHRGGVESGGGEDFFVALAKRAPGVGGAGLLQQYGDATDAGFDIADFFQRLGFVNLPLGEVLQLLAREKTAACRTIGVNRAARFPVGRAWLLKKVPAFFALDMQAEFDQICRHIVRLQADVVEENAIATQPALVAKPGGGGGGVGFRKRHTA